MLGPQLSKLLLAGLALPLALSGLPASASQDPPADQTAESEPVEPEEDQEAKQQQTAAIEAFNEGATANNTGDRATAIRKFQEALEIWPELHAAHSALALVFIAEERYEEALAEAEAALEADPDDELAARVQRDAGRALAGLGPEPWPVESVAQAEESGEETGDSRAASETSEKPDLTASKSPGDSRRAAALVAEAKALREEGSEEEAGAKLEEAVEADPTHPQAHYQLGLHYLAVDEPESAKRHLRRFLQLAPRAPEAGAADELLSFLE